MLIIHPLVKRIVIVLLFTALIGYGLFQSRNLIYGPQIHISSPENGATIASSTVIIRGSVEHIVDITLNDRTIFIDEERNFEEELLLEEGYTIIELTAHDRFGRSITKTLELVGEPPDAQELPT